MVSKNFYEEIETISRIKQIDIEDVKRCVVTALEKAFAAEGHIGILEVTFDDEKKQIRIYEHFTVIPDPEEENYYFQPGEITLDKALEIKSRVRVGSEFKIAQDFKCFRRTGQSRFKQVFTQELRNCTIKAAYEYFTSMIGEVITAKVERCTENSVILDIGYNCVSFMPVSDGLSGEQYFEGKEIPVCITKVEETTKGPKVFVTRSEKEIIKRLFETFIPEIMDGTVEIMSIARDAGYRTKVSVKSNNPNVDAKGSCVGIGGARIRQINTALNGERIDLFDYSDDPAIYIKEALTPATCLGVLLYPEEKKAIAVVSDEEFSLAIGKGGQNVRLANQATGWKIDIKDETTALRDEIRFTRF